ncbi:MAG: FlgO family outer membrane protein [Thiotrichales bacterium]|nr:FlgO family outer membrane protein [Thiotrichales bacterium]
MKTIAIKLACLSVLLLTACSTIDELTSPLLSSPVTSDIDLVNANKQAATQLVGKKHDIISQEKSVISSTFVNLDNLEQTTPMGRLLSEQISAELTRLGYQMVELKLRQDEVLIQELEGEFVLTRDTEKLMLEHDAQAFLIGTYTVASNTMYVTSRLVNPNDNTVISAHNYNIALGPNALTLINRELPDHRAKQAVPTNKEWYEQQVIEDDDIVAF